MENLDLLEAKVKYQAENYDTFRKFKFIALERSRQKKVIMKNFVKMENFDSGKNKFESDFNKEKQQENKKREQDKEDDKDEDFDIFYGIENERYKEMKDKIEKSKRRKGRGILVSFFEFNQELRIPRLIRAMKSGLRIGLVSDAGTPTISDPGF